MSWFTDFLTDTARQAAPGIHQGINDDQKKRRELEQARSGIPIEVERQKALMPGEIEKVDAIGRAAQARDSANQEAAFRRALALQYLKNQTKAQPPDDPIGRVLGGKYTMQNPNYSASEEAAGGMGGVAPNENVGGLEYLRRSQDVPTGHVPKISQGPKGTNVEWEAPRITTGTPSTRASGMTNPLIQAGMYLGFGPNISEWTPEQHKAAEGHELEKKIAGSINLDRKLFEDTMKMFPGDRLAGLNEFMRVLMTRGASTSYGNALGPTLTSPPVPYPNSVPPPGATVQPPSGNPVATPPQSTSVSPDLTPDEQKKLGSMSPAEKKAFLSARGTAGGTKPSEETKRQVSAGLNVARMLDELTQGDGIEKYGFSGRRALEEGRDILSGATLGAIKPSKEYSDFRQILRQIELGAFDFGGKQLTQTEKDFVMAALPSTWQRTPVAMRAAIKEFSERIRYMTGLWSKFASLSGAEYENLVKSELSKYGGGGGAPQGASPSAPATGGGWSIKPKGR